ncbi:hypothetical protein K2173_015469 [Erythroxylum novogranatense]|uniref:Hapless 8 n=1 Tax=Erythroxylum novogranatense TaxID=1862640 RepID=A0AAV8SRN8_9ROSI|nr:hypothetical protein K2173_015469 [Erythroxylum novogranatense]
MLSVENSPTPDPSCSCKFPKVNSSNDELPLPQVDLPNPSLDHLSSLPNFSIRNYVFTSRSKDINNNWPFSLKNLQLCFKHGVRDVLPPFQSLDTIRDQSSKLCTVETDSLNRHRTNRFDKEPSRPNNTHGVVDSCTDAQLRSRKAAEVCPDVSSCRSGEEIDFPSSTTTVSQSEIESVPHIRHPISLQQTHQTLLKTSSAEVETVDPPAIHKTQNTSRPLGKKCRLIVKFVGNSERSSSEDITSNCTTTSEAMTSKVCPVCKTFSFSSITTLNAHIDQCLAMEPTPKCTADSNLTRHRFKPRKTKLMVDIYATAQQCTLEELDRRNGRNLSTASNLPTMDAECSEGRKHRVSPINPQDVGDVGPVYIDANGTKLRILSKPSDPALVRKERECVEDRNPLRGGKGIKHFPKKKKKRLAQKHHKYLKLIPQSKRILSHKNARGSQICGRGEKYNGGDRSFEKEQLKQKQSKSSDSGTLRPWVCSKRSGFMKKVSSEDDHQPTRCKWHLPKDLLVENEESFLGNPLSESILTHKSKNLCENLVSASGNDERMRKAFHDAPVIERGEKIPRRKRVGNLLARAVADDIDTSFPPTKQNANQLGKEGTSTHNSCLPMYTNSTRRHASNEMEVDTWGKNIMSVNSQSAVSDSGPCKIKKRSTHEKSRLHLVVERDKEAVACHSKVDHQLSLKRGGSKIQLEREAINNDMHPRRQNALEIREERQLSAFQSKKVMALESSKPAACYGNDEGGNVDYSDGFGVLTSCRNETQDNEEDFCSVECGRDFDRSASNLNSPFGTEFYKLSDCSKAPSNSLQSIQDHRRLLCKVEAPAAPTEPAFVDDQEMFSGRGVRHDLIEQTTEISVGLDSRVGQGNPFLGVDPIPIPGPPGSFLPSPRDMGSEDFQGNSSLTTSRVQSSLDQHDMLDGDSSDSPISATSTISSSPAGRSDSKYCEPMSAAGPYGDQEKIKSCLTAARSGSSVKIAGAQTTNTGLERTIVGGVHLKADRIPGEKGSLRLKNDQPCCCQKKERFSLGVSSHFHELQLKKRRKITTRTTALGKQTSCNSEPQPSNVNVRPEFIPLSSWSTSGSEKDVPPVIKPHTVPVPFKDSTGTEVRFLARSDCDSVSPSASNPILRLMGKNLMVINKDEDASMPIGQVEPHMRDIERASQFPTFSRVCPVNIQDQNPYQFNRMIPQGSAISSRDPHSTMGHCFDVGFSNNMRAHSEDWKFPLASARLPAGIFQGPCTDSGSMTLKEPYDYQKGQNLVIWENGVKNGLDASPRYPEKNVATLDHQCKLSDSTAAPIKEVIIIDDVPEGENIETNDVLMGSDGWRERQVDSSLVSIQTAPNYNANLLHPLSWYQSQGPAYLDEPHIVHNPCFRAAATRVVNATPVAWVCSSDGSGVLQRNPFVAPSSSTSHLRSAGAYYPPSFS